MNGRIRMSAVCLALILGVPGATAFSLLGPRPPWQVAQLNYQLPGPGPHPSVGALGPMNINEEYRWNVPTIYYGFTREFLTYYGEEGEKAVEAAIADLNAIPDLETVDLSDYGTESGRVNLRAQELGLVDVKSTAMSLLLQMLGLGDPTRYVFTLRNRYVEEGTPFYHIVKRNFDPVTLDASSYVNGTLWTYSGIIEGLGWTVINRFPIDPIERYVPRTLPVVSDSLISPGYFWTHLTRDDIGGLKFLYSSSNFNPEISVPGVTRHALPTDTGGAVDPNAGTVGQQTTQFTGGSGPFDFPQLGGSDAGVFDFPATFGLTNQVAAPPAVRPGLSNIKMVRADYDALLGVFFEPIVERFQETILTNDRAQIRSLTREITTPDIIFDARDLQGGAATDVWFSVATGSPAWLNSDALDGITGDDFGPGTISPPFRAVFNTAGIGILNSALFDDEPSGFELLVWGSFDGTAREPIVFPVGTSILDVERRLRR